MKYTERLLKNERFLRIQQEIREDEKERIYCHHELEHGLDVARIAWVLCMEECVIENKTDRDIGRCMGGGFQTDNDRECAADEQTDNDRECAVDGQPDTGDDCAVDGHPYMRGNICREEAKDRIYVTGLIHDIGRSVQYRTGEHHAIAGAEIARQILSEIDYPEKWISEVCDFIREHHGRQYAYSDKSQVGYYIERADKLSRNCFCCPAADTCKWSEAEKNQTVKV